MDHLSEHRIILEKAISDQLPSKIDRTSDISVEIFHELFEEGLVTGLNASSMNLGTAYINPSITLKDREYLNALNQRLEDTSLKGRAKKLSLVVIGWLGGVVSTLLAGWLGKLL